MLYLCVDKVKELLSKCLQAKDMAHCPYSQFPVGAAILTEDGAIITGEAQYWRQYMDPSSAM